MTMSTNETASRTTVAVVVRHNQHVILVIFGLCGVVPGFAFVACLTALRPDLLEFDNMLICLVDAHDNSNI